MSDPVAVGVVGPGFW